jgi:hypothetical protein
MPRPLQIALHCEGNHDAPLAIFARRVVDELTANLADPPYIPDDAILLTDRDKAKAHRSERVITALRPRASQVDLVFVHQDADARDASDTRRSLEPVVSTVRETFPELAACPMIPVRNTESWLLADPSAVERTIGVRLPLADRADRPEQVEQLPSPKQTLQTLIRDRRRRGRLHGPPDYLGYYLLIAEQASWDLLLRVPSFHAMVRDTGIALAQLGFA